MATHEILERKKTLEAELAKIREAMKATSGKFVRDALQPFFESHPEIGAIRWAQYTPYFNDGDACQFGSHHDYPEVRLAAGGEWDEVYVPYKIEEKPAEEQAKHAWKVELKTLLSAFSDDDMEAMFGDHARVIVTRDGVQVDEYSHD